ncbi:MAG TPA: response regulator transcription factor [Acidimicrobiales bacterium]|nr:response regulator transcription factor [Acidimicrobiales bacterium]
MSSAPVRVLLADDHPVYRLGLSALLSSLEGFEVAGEAANGTEAVAQAAALRPDVVVMDLQMPEMNGIDATRRIVNALPDVAVLVLTYSDEDHSVLDAVLAGARGYVLKDAGMDAILRAIEDVAAGEMILGPSVAKSLRERLAAGPMEPARPFPDLTERELEVLELMAQGLNNASIALRLHVGDKRVRNIVTEIYSKLGVAGRPQAIIVAREAGLGRNPTTPA